MEPVKTIHNRNSFVIMYECRKCKEKKRFNAAENDNKEMLFAFLVN
jgi:hypothetical protein